MAKSFGFSTSTQKGILRQKDVVETKSDRLRNSAIKISILKGSSYAEVETVLIEWLHQPRSAIYIIHAAQVGSLCLRLKTFYCNIKYSVINSSTM